MSFQPGVAQQGITTLQTAPSVSGATTLQNVTLTGTTGSKITLRKVFVYGTAAATFTLAIKSGSTTVVDLGTQAFPTNGALAFDVNPLTFPDGVNCVIAVGAASAGTTTVTFIADKS